MCDSSIIPTSHSSTSSIHFKDARFKGNVCFEPLKKNPAHTCAFRNNYQNYVVPSYSGFLEKAAVAKLNVHKNYEIECKIYLPILCIYVPLRN